MAKKIVGWVLLAAGVLVVAWGIWSSIQIFTAKKPVPEVFKETQIEKIVPGSSQKTGVPGTMEQAQEQMQEQMQQVIGEQLGKLLPAETITGLLNLIAWSIFMTILIFAGGKIATIGIKLLAAK